MYKEWNEISYAHAHEWMDDACAHEMQVPNAMLNTGVLYTPWEKPNFLIDEKDDRW